MNIADNHCIRLTQLQFLQQEPAICKAQVQHWSQSFVLSVCGAQHALSVALGVALVPSPDHGARASHHSALQLYRNTNNNIAAIQSHSRRPSITTCDECAIVKPSQVDLFVTVAPSPCAPATTSSRRVHLWTTPRVRPHVYVQDSSSRVQIIAKLTDNSCQWQVLLNAKQLPFLQLPFPGLIGCPHRSHRSRVTQHLAGQCEAKECL